MPRAPYRSRRSRRPKSSPEQIRDAFNLEVLSLVRLDTNEFQVTINGFISETADMDSTKIVAYTADHENGYTGTIAPQDDNVFNLEFEDDVRPGDKIVIHPRIGILFWNNDTDQRIVDFLQCVTLYAPANLP